MSSSIRHTFILLLLCYLLVIAPFSALSVAARAVPSKRVNATHEQSLAQSRAGELLVRFRAGVSRRDKDTLIATHGARKKKELKGDSGIEQLDLPAGQDAQSASVQMLLSGQVEFAEPNFVIAKDDVIPNDSQFNEQWALRNTGQNGGQYDSDVKASPCSMTIVYARRVGASPACCGCNTDTPGRIVGAWSSRAIRTMRRWTATLLTIRWAA